jgi:hypothetical protein
VEITEESPVVAVGAGRSVTYRGGVRGVVRRRPPGLWAGGLRCCVAVLAVVGLWLGTGTTRLHFDDHLTASLSHRAALAVPLVRPTPADDDATPIPLVVLVLALAGVLVCTRRPPSLARSHPRRASGRAPPSSLLQA